MDYYIVTGVSRGIGAAIARSLLMQGNTIFCASRTINEDLVDTASSLHIPLFYHETDLSEPGAPEKFLHEVFTRVDPVKARRIALINNAGMLEPMIPIDLAHSDIMGKHIRLNLLAPSILSSLFISDTRALPIPKVILNISSGASSYPYAGWAMYCASKAGLDMFTKAVGLEQSAVENPAKIFAIAPGIVDTAMQTLIRQTDKANFSEKEMFVKIHEAGRLISPENVASVIVNTLFNNKIPQGGVLTIDQLKSYQV
jgi:benzil reductase ((S)-benzoin forming)